MSISKTIRQRVSEIVQQLLNVDEEQVVDTANFANDLGADSLDQIELVMAVESEFQSELPNNGVISEADAAKFATFGDVVTYLEKKVTAPAEQ